MKQLQVLLVAQRKPWYRPGIYLSAWKENAGTRCAILTRKDVIGWGLSWEEALEDADKQYAAKGVALSQTVPKTVN